MFSSGRGVLGKNGESDPLYPAEKFPLYTKTSDNQITKSRLPVNDFSEQSRQRCWGPRADGLSDSLAEVAFSPGLLSVDVSSHCVETVFDGIEMRSVRRRELEYDRPALR